MNRNYVVCNSEGRITRLITGPAIYLECDRDDVDPDVDYVDLSGPSPAIKKKHELSVDYVISDLEVTFSQLPEGTRVIVEEQEITAENDASIEFDVPGTYQIALCPPPAWKRKEVEVTIG